MIRKPLLLLFTALLLIVPAVWAVTLTLFQATPDGTSVRIEWEVLSEAGVTSFDLYRRGGNDANFDRVTVISPTGQRRYQYTDANLYRGTTGTAGGGPYTYRLTVHSSGAADQSYTTSLTQTPSAVQRSWGSIKSMFR
ncbi:hypothetical protein F0P96_06760 [Hymenobacter busanensis]|uniref:Uncharacterized protein n=1 Tax=Hymenobacter busanensis TaxID=2607656 RepID=A0A7L4ZZU0_9BACT|nr:hypothetical protein [Hymenobacter busanensis]KAA9338528.1 hypothetical protein F0P96_06760 [Hymenobacter busanensis]QHJ09044.1 hypothetical protein GUY19_17840 [Hymenobacter busanensis]